MSTTPESTSTGLPQNQELAAIALAAGASIAAAAYEAKVTRQQVHKWLHTAPFAAIVQDERAKRVQNLRARIDMLSNRAIGALERILYDPDKPASVQLRAALAVLNRTADMENGWRLAIPIDSTSYENGLDIVDTAKADLERPALNEAIAHPASPEPEVTEIDKNRHFSETQPTVPRNAPCPCGSTEKYKRCCGRAAPPVLSQAVA